jgi:stearoyl-CoA desaturase (delta-9 desaturase)
MALLTFGEGYHNYHHEFQHDYRNGVKPWQFDPTKWAIWCLSLIGFTSQLRRVPAEKILLSEIAEKQRRLDAHLATRRHQLCEQTQHLLQSAQERLHKAAQNWETRKQEYVKATEKKIEASRERLHEMKHELERAAERLMAEIHAWHEARQLALAQLA